MASTLQEAKRKAQFGHRDWIGYGKKGERQYAPLSKAALKAALLATGTQSHFTLISANTGHLMGVNWPMGTSMLRNIAFLLAA